MSVKPIPIDRGGNPISDFVIPQDWKHYTERDHETWRTLFERQSSVVQGRACKEYLDGLEELDVAARGIPDFEILNKKLWEKTKWRIVAVPGLVPDDVFFKHLSERRFPVTRWIRGQYQMDYLQEPDIFHDLFGHVPLLINPVFANYLEAYGKGGIKAHRLNALQFLARLYWYTVEFGLIQTPDGLRIYGSGIVSSRKETVACLEDPSPQRVVFDLKRIMRTKYEIDKLQLIYFVIPSFEALFEATYPDFTPIYTELERRPEIASGVLVSGDTLIIPL